MIVQRDTSKLKKTHSLFSQKLLSMESFIATDIKKKAYWVDKRNTIDKGVDDDGTKYNKLAAPIYCRKVSSEAITPARRTPGFAPPNRICFTSLELPRCQGT